MFNSIDFSIYVAIFRCSINQAAEHNIAQALGVELVKRRNKEHAITLSGQAMHFAAENVLFGLFIVATNSNATESPFFCLFTRYATALLLLVQLAAVHF